jgi:hypothetical protein
MTRTLLAVLLCVGSAGCAAYWRSHTEGTSGPITWYVINAKAGLKAEAAVEPTLATYAFTLVLQQTDGAPITFTTMTYTVYSGTTTHAPSTEQTRQGTWRFQPGTTYRFPFTFTVTCPELTCIKTGWLSPRYHIVFTGTDNQGTPVRTVIDLHLPPEGM